MLDDYIRILNVDGVHEAFLNKDPGLDTFFAPLNTFEVTPTDRSDSSRTKMQRHGTWGTRSYLGGQSIHMEGVLFGDTPADYWAARQDILLAIYGDPDANVTDYNRGTIYAKPSESTEFWAVQFGPATTSIPLRANLLGSEFMITLGTFDPFWVGQTSGDKFWWS